MNDAIIDALLADGHTIRFDAAGDSMDPLIRSGDRLLVEPVDVAVLRRGDVVLARLPRGLTAHRVVRIDGGTITTRGDNADGDDAPFTAAELLGRITAIERDGQRLGTARSVATRLHGTARRLRRRMR